MFAATPVIVPLMSMTEKMRLDAALAARGLAPSRSRGQALVREGAVTVGGIVATRPSQLVSRDDNLAVADVGALHYVSRGAHKLVAALDAFAFDPADRICLDLGASTGGFTQVLLERGAAKVYAIDVGAGQLHERVRCDPRMVNLEKTHAKAIDAAIVPEFVAAIVCDVSFISLQKALPYALARAGGDAFLVALIKPQFEFGPEKIGKGGLVRAVEDDFAALIEEMSRWVAAMGWHVAGVIDSPVRGGDGNREFLLGATKT